ncbi:MAG: shikimate kinase [Gammaproteobacteria bacterium]|nr:shikimate kinase [Gammaproteobacteria bacterium]
MKNKNIYIVGPLGAGKTTVGRQLAKKVHFVFYDTDQEIEKQTGVSVSTIFEIEGEAGFRDREQKMVEKLTQLDNIVLSSGGGSILKAENRAAFSARGTVIYLCASLETQLKRTNQRKGTRPLLNIPDPYQKIVEFDQIRSPLYESIANHTYNTDVDSPQEIADKIYDMVFSRNI